MRFVVVEVSQEGTETYWKVVPEDFKTSTRPYLLNRYEDKQSAINECKRRNSVVVERVIYP